MFPYLPYPPLQPFEIVPVRPRNLVYAAKFLCGDLQPDNPPQPAGPVRPGRYSTAINIHNPNRREVEFIKKAVLLYNSTWPEAERERHEVPHGPERVIDGVRLLPDWGMEID